MNYVSINQRGTAHKNGECEDALFVSQDKTVFCLADGVSNSRYGAVGAKLVVTELGKRFKTLKYKRLLNTGSVEEVRIEICKVIDEVLVLLCKKYNETDKDAFASTFLALVQTDSNNITILHAGDGAVFGQPKTNQKNFATILSYPDNDSDGSVYSAGNSDQVNRMRVIRLKTDDYNSLMLCTDGFSEAYLVPSFQAYNVDSITKAFEAKSNEELQRLVYREHICERGISDDISCVICRTSDSFPDPKDKNNWSIERTIIEEVKTTETYEIPEKTDRKVPINQIEYSQSHKKGETSKVSKYQKKTNTVLFVAIVIFFIISIVFGVRLKEAKKANAHQDTQISSLQERISSFAEKINEIESITQKDDSAQSSTELETTSQVFNSGNTTESYHSDESEAVTENNNVHNFQDTYIYN